MGLLLTLSKDQDKEADGTENSANNAWNLNFNNGNQNNNNKSTNRNRVRPVSALIWKQWSRVKTYSKPTSIAGIGSAGSGPPSYTR